MLNFLIDTSDFRECLLCFPLQIIGVIVAIKIFAYFFLKIIYMGMIVTIILNPSKMLFYIVDIFQRTNTYGFDDFFL